MRKLILQIDYTPQSTPPHGTPPAFEVNSGPGTVSVLAGSDPELNVPTAASYSTTVSPTEVGTFDEVGTYLLDGHELRITTVGAGTMHPTDENGTQWGSVTWLLEGSGGLTGVFGFVTSNIELDERTNVGDDREIVRLFVPD